LPAQFLAQCSLVLTGPAKTIRLPSFFGFIEKPL
jgi:hypothetical protein